MADETNATPSAPEDMPQGTGKITIADICQCDNPCECMKDYEVRVTVVTRLAGIPVSGVRMEVAGQSLVSDGDGLLTAFKSDAEELNLELTYANQQAQLKTETVTVALKNLLPTCLAVKKDGAGQSGATAEFEHFIPKIRDVLDLPEQAAMALRQEAEKEVAQAERDLQWAQIKLENVESQYPNIPASDVLALKELAAKEVEGAEKKLAEAWQKVAAARQEEKFAEFAALNDDELKKKTDEKIQKVGPDNVDADFNDTYTIQATAYTEPPEDTETTATPPQGAAFENVDSALQVEKTPANRIIFHLRVALATFSLAVPYMSQVASHVDILRRPQGETGRSGVETWIPIAMTTGNGIHGADRRQI